MSEIAFTTPEEDLRDSYPGPAPRKPFLFIILHCDQPGLGGARFDLADIDVVTLGRGEQREASRVTEQGVRQLDVRLPTSAVSRSHARLMRAADGWYLEDAGSRNGCFLNGRRISRARLSDGDVLEIGFTLLRYRAALPVLPGNDGDFASSVRSSKSPTASALSP